MILSIFVCLLNSVLYVSYMSLDKQLLYFYYLYCFRESLSLVNKSRAYPIALFELNPKSRTVSMKICSRVPPGKFRQFNVRVGSKV